jgi:hypothetical protein
MVMAKKFTGKDEFGVPRATKTWYTSKVKATTPVERSRDPRLFVRYSCYKGPVDLYVEWNRYKGWYFYSRGAVIKGRAKFKTAVDAMDAALFDAESYARKQTSEILRAREELHRLMGEEDS